MAVHAARVDHLEAALLSSQSAAALLQQERDALQRQLDAAPRQVCVRVVTVKRLPSYILKLPLQCTRYCTHTCSESSPHCAGRWWRQTPALKSSLRLQLKHCLQLRLRQKLVRTH